MTDGLKCTFWLYEYVPEKGNEGKGKRRIGGTWSDDGCFSIAGTRSIRMTGSISGEVEVTVRWKNVFPIDPLSATVHINGVVCSIYVTYKDNQLLVEAFASRWYPPKTF